MLVDGVFVGDGAKFGAVAAFEDRLGRHDNIVDIFVEEVDGEVVIGKGFGPDGTTVAFADSDELLLLLVHHDVW